MGFEPNFSKNTDPCDRITHEHIVATGKLQSRRSKPKNLESENRFLRGLTRHLNEAADSILSKLAEVAVELCGAESAGISLSELQHGQEVFRYSAVSGKFGKLQGHSVAKAMSPCGFAIREKSTQLLENPGRYYSYITELDFPVREMLVAPFFLGGEAVGTIWLVSNSAEKEFDSEDARLLEALAEFASTAFHLKKSSELQLKADGRLASSRVELATVMESMSDCFSAIDKDWMILEVNRAQEKISGIKREDQIGKNFKELFLSFPGAEKTKLWAAYQKAMTERVPVTVEELSYSFKDWVSAHIYPSPDGGLVTFLRDISVRKDFERDLTFEKKKLEAFFHESPAPLCILRGEELIFDIVNPGYQALFPGRELLGKPLYEAVPELADQKFPEELRKVLRTGEKFVLHETLIRLAEEQGGKIKDKYFDITYARVDGPRGRPFGVYAYAQEVTERRNNAIELERARKHLYDFFMQAPLPLVILEGKEHRFTMANPPYEKLVGAKVLGKTVSEALGPEIARNYTPLLDGVLQTGIPYLGKEVSVEFVNEAGIFEPRTLNFGYYPFRNGVNEIVGVFAIVEDVTDQVATRKGIESALSQISTEQQKLELIVNESAAAIGIMRGPGLIFERVNDKWEGLVSPRKYIGRPYAEIYPELVGSPAIASILHTFRTGESFIASEMKLTVTSPRGKLEEQYFDFRNVRILDGKGNPYGVYCHASNVTERVLARENLLKQSETLAANVAMLKEEREVRERFVNALTHDLRTPMTAARMSAQLIARNAKDNESIQKLSARTVASIDRTDRMIQDLLDANRLKAGNGLPISAICCDMVEIASLAVKDFKEVYGARFELLSDSEAIRGFWDPSYIQRVLENLVANAIKYGLQDSPVTVALKELGDKVEISVHNKGDAIPAADQRTLFDAYKRTAGAISGGQKGWGIGLSLVKGIAEAHHGSVRIVSAPDIGTTFILSLPKNSAPNPDQRIS